MGPKRTCKETQLFRPDKRWLGRRSAAQQPAMV